MNKNFLLRNLSTVTLVIIYLCLVVMHFVNDGFILENQIGLMITMLPFVFMGFALDFLLSRNTSLDSWMRITSQLMPLGIFLMQVVTTIFIYLGKESFDFFQHLIWIFISLPFFIASYEKENMKPRVMKTLMGTGAVVVVYLFLLTQTRELTYGVGEIIYFIYYFLMLYVVSGIKKLPYIGTMIGILNAVFLLFLRYVPITANAKEYGWDYDIAMQMELLILATFVLSVVIRLVQMIRTKSTKIEA